MALSWLIILGMGLLAGTIAGVIGFGGTTILLPILTLVFGAKAAVPIMAIAAILGNLARVAVWWREIAWAPVTAFGAAAAPAAWLGARTMLALDPKVLEFCLGLFFIAIILPRRWLAASGLRIGLVGIALAGAGVGYLTGIVANTGPINTPFFLAYGLVKGAFVGTEAMSSLVMFTSKAAAFRAFGGLPWTIVVDGVIVGTSVMAGAFLAKRFVHAINEVAFRGLMDVLLLVAGFAMIVSGLR